MEVVSFTGIGVGKFVDLTVAAQHGITVCNCPGYADNAVAEHTLALLLAAARQVPRLDRELRSGRWNQTMPGFKLRGKALGLIGFGGIGRRFCRIAQALGMKVIVWTRNPDQDRAARWSTEFVALDALLMTSDVISLHLPLTSETAGLIGARELELTKPGVLLVNTARGELIDEKALLEALSTGQVGAAGLDVYAHEPLAEKHPLTSLDNVVPSPHVAFNTPEATEVMYEWRSTIWCSTTGVSRRMWL